MAGCFLQGRCSIPIMGRHYLVTLSEQLLPHTPSTFSRNGRTFPESEEPGREVPTFHLYLVRTFGMGVSSWSSSYPQ